MPLSWQLLLKFNAVIGDSYFMLKPSLVISTLIATTIFISPHSLLAGQEETSGTPATTASTPAKLPIKAQLKEDHFNFSLKMMQWDHDQKEKAETAAPVTVAGLEAETRPQAALRTLLDMRNADGLTPLHLALTNKLPDLTRLFLVALGEESNSPLLVTKDGNSLLFLALWLWTKPTPSADAVFDTIIALRESGYKFDNSKIKHFRLFEKAADPTKVFGYDYNNNELLALAILLGADKSHISYKIKPSGTNLVHYLSTFYTTLSEKGLAHLVDIDSSFETPLKEKLNLDKLKKQSEENRQKKSQLKQLDEAKGRLNLN